MDENITMETDRRRAAQATDSQQRSYGSDVRLRASAAAGWSDCSAAVLAAVTRGAPTSKRTAAKRVATVFVLALLTVSERDTSSHGSSKSASKVGSAAECSFQDGLGEHSQNSGAGIHSAQSAATWVALAAAQMVLITRKDPPPRRPLLQGIHELPFARKAGLEGRLRGSGGRLEALRFQHRGKQAEQPRTRTALPMELAAAGRSEKYGTLVTAEHQEDAIVPNRSNSRPHASGSGAALPALHARLNRPSTLPRHLAAAELPSAAGAQPEAEAGRVSASLTKTATGAASRGLRIINTQDWLKTHLPHFREEKSAPLSHVLHEDDNGHAIAEALDPPTNEEDGIHFSVDDGDSSYPSHSLAPMLADKSRMAPKNSAVGVVDLNTTDHTQGTSGKSNKLVRRGKLRDTPSGHESTAGYAEPVARSEHKVPVEGPLFALMDRQRLVDKDVQPVRSGERREVLAARGETATDADLLTASANIPEILVDPATTEGLNDTDLFAAAVAGGEAATKVAANKSAMLPEFGRYSETKLPSPSARRYDTIAPWAPPEVLHYFNRRPSSSGLSPRPIMSPRLPSIPEESDDGPSYLEMYPPPSAEDDGHTAGARQHWEDEQLEYLLNLPSPSLFQVEHAKHFELPSQQKQEADGETLQQISADIIRPSVAQKLYLAPATHASANQSSHNIGASPEGLTEEGSTTEVNGESGGSGIQGNSRNHSGSASNTEDASSPPTTKLRNNASKSSSVGMSGMGSSSGDQKSEGKIRPPVGPSWRRPPPAVSTAGSVLVARPHPSWFAYFPKYSNGNTEKPVRPYPTTFPRPSALSLRPRDDFPASHNQIMCQLSGEGPACVPSALNERQETTATRDTRGETNRENVGDEEGYIGDDDHEGDAVSSQEESNAGSARVPVSLVPSFPDTLEPGSPPDTYLPQKDEAQSLPLPSASDEPTLAPFIAPPSPSRPEQLQNVHDFPCAHGDEKDECTSSDASGEGVAPRPASGFTEFYSGPPGKGVDPRPASGSTELPPGPSLPTSVQVEILPPAKPTVGTSYEQSPTVETNSSSAGPVPMPHVTLPPKPTATTTATPTPHGTKTSSVTPSPSTFVPFLRPQPYLTLPFVLPPTGIPSNPLLPSFTAPHFLPEPLATVVGALVVH